MREGYSWHYDHTIWASFGYVYGVSWFWGQLCKITPWQNIRIIALSWVLFFKEIHDITLIIRWCPLVRVKVARLGFFGFKSDTAVLTFTFRFLSFPLFSLFLPHLFFSLAGHLVGFILVGIVFRKAFRILGLGERKGRWAMEQDFHGDFQVNVTWFFASFSGVLDWIVLILVWFERSLHSAQVRGQSCPWPLKLIMSQRVERTWIRTGSYGRFRGKWVNWKIIVVEVTETILSPGK